MERKFSRGFVIEGSYTRRHFYEKTGVVRSGTGDEKDPRVSVSAKEQRAFFFHFNKSRDQEKYFTGKRLFW